MAPSLQFVLPTSELHGGIRLPLEIAGWLTDSGWITRVVGPGHRPDWHPMVVPWFSADLGSRGSVPRADITIATFYTTVGPALASGSSHVFHLCQGYEGLFREYDDVCDRIDAAYREPIPKLVVSHHLETTLTERYPGTRYHFIGEAVDPRIFSPLGFRRFATPLRIGLIGSFSARVKGVREGLAGLRIARRAGLKLEVHRASTEPLTEEERAFGMTDIFEHRLPTTEMPRFYGAIDALLFPSTAEEGFGLPVLEAMACGVPVAHSTIPSLAALPEDATLRFAPGDLEAIAEVVRRLTDPDVRSTLRTAGLAAADEFRPHTLVTRLEEALHNEGCEMP